MLGLESSEQSLLSTQYLHGAGWMFGEIDKTASVANQPRTDQIAHQSSEIGGDGVHTVPQVLCELRTVFGDGNDLVAEGVNVVNVGF